MGHGPFRGEGPCRGQGVSLTTGLEFLGMVEVGIGLRQGPRSSEDSPSHSAPEWGVVVKSAAPWSFIAGEGQGKWGPAGLKLQLRASEPRAPEKVALIPNQQNLAADSPTQGHLDGGSGERYLNQAGLGKGYSVQVLDRAGARKGRMVGSKMEASSQVYGIAARAQLVNLSAGIQKLLLQQGLLGLQLRSRLWGVAGGWGQGLVGS